MMIHEEPEQMESVPEKTEQTPQAGKTRRRSVVILEIVLVAALVSALLFWLLVCSPALKGGKVSPLFPSFLEKYLPEDSDPASSSVTESVATPTPTPAPTKTPTPTPEPTPTPIPAPKLDPGIKEIMLPSFRSVSPGDWNLILVNKAHPIPKDYEFELENYADNWVGGGRTFGLDARIVEPLDRMLEACTKAGCSPQICSAYRDSDRQSSLYDQSEYRSAHPEDEITSVALPGTSEHEIGMAVDIYSYESYELEESQENTDVQKWLMAHCHEYGFILRYPKGKEAITEIVYEPWHYRYVGLEAARDIMESGLTLEEYVERLNTVKAAETALKEQTAAKDLKL